MKYRHEYDEFNLTFSGVIKITKSLESNLNLLDVPSCRICSFKTLSM